MKKNTLLFYSRNWFRLEWSFDSPKEGLCLIQTVQKSFPNKESFLNFSSQGVVMETILCKP
jgi:hypothetical protein